MKNTLTHNIKPLGADCEVRFSVDDDIYSKQYDEEVLWAKSSDETGSIEILSIPYLIYGINPGDIIRRDKFGKFDSLITDAGKYTYRIAIRDAPHDKHKIINDSIIKLLKNNKFLYEQMNILIVSVMAKNKADAVKLENLLINMLNNGLIEAYDTTR